METAPELSDISAIFKRSDGQMSFLGTSDTTPNKLALEEVVQVIGLNNARHMKTCLSTNYVYRKPQPTIPNTNSRTRNSILWKMRQSLRYASWLLLLFILLSCSHRVTGEATALPPILQAEAQSQKYNLQLDFMKHHFSGMLIVRQMPDNEIRILGSTYFGLSLFDYLHWFSSCCKRWCRTCYFTTDRIWWYVIAD